MPLVRRPILSISSLLLNVFQPQRLGGSFSTALASLACVTSASRPAAAGDRETKMAALTCSIVWFKHSNLRLHDNEAFYKAHAPAGGHSAVLHVFVFDPFWFGRTSFGFLKTGHFRARFLLESLVDLRANLKKQGSTLIVRTGYAPDVLASLVEATKATRVYSQAETCSEEQAIDREVQKSVAAKGASLVSCWGGSTMYDLQDLPFTLNLASGSASGGAASAIAAGATGHSKKPQCFPQIYTQFRKTVESTCTIREPLPAVPLKVSPR